VGRGGYTPAVDKNHDTETLKPLAITKKESYRYVGIPSLVQDWLYYSRRTPEGEEPWVIIVREGGRGSETIIDRASIDRAYALYLRGIKPPPIPSRQKKRQEPEQQIP